MPSTPVAAAMTASGSAVLTMMAGSALPAGKDWARRSLAEIASGFWRNWSEDLSPVSMKAMPAAMTASTTSVMLMTRFGCAATRSPTLRQSDWLSARADSPSRGTRGQKIQRSKMTSTAGSTRSTKKAATTMPTAQASPRPRVAGKSESSRVSRPRTTVTELDSTASAVRRSASDIASRRSWRLRSSSR